MKSNRNTMFTIWDCGMKNKSNVWLGVCAAVLMVIAGVLLWAVLNRQWVYDFWRGLSYEPKGEMGRILKDLELTERGEFLFKAAWPRLSSRDEFNVKCRSGNEESEAAVLGCYVGDNIYVYNIDSAELSGIRELTTAHELLHAVWARMDERERQEVAAALGQVLEQNRGVLGDELNYYNTSEQQEELFVRAGTEVKNLPESLEKLYGEVFRDQDLVVSYYDKYIAVFRRIEAEMEALMAEMKAIEAEIETKTAEYEQRAEQLNQEVAEFNRCAETMGCFTDEGVFYARRGELLNEQAALDTLYEEMNGLVDEYNTRVEKYNADVTRTEKLNQTINSASEREEL